jgi:hypothetical protein
MGASIFARSWLPALILSPLGVDIGNKSSSRAVVETWNNTDAKPTASEAIVVPHGILVTGLKHGVSPLPTVLSNERLAPMHDLSTAIDDSID